MIKVFKFIIPCLDKEEVHTAVFDEKTSSYIVDGDTILSYSQIRVAQAFQLGHWVVVTE